MEAALSMLGDVTIFPAVEQLHDLGLDITIGKAYFNGQIKHSDLVALNRKLISLDIS